MPARTDGGAATGTLHWFVAETELGPLLAASTARGLCRLFLRTEGALGELRAWARVHEPQAEPREDEDALCDVLDQLEAFGAGDLREFDLPLDLRGTPFQIRAWRELLGIPFGTTRTYGQLAARLGRPGASRAVGAASGANPVPIVVPCHRVVAADGLGGFSGGLDWKRRLLEHEGILLFS